MNHALRGSLRSFTIVACIFWFAAAAWAKEPDLRAGEAFVIVKVTGDVNTLSFQQFQGLEKFTAQRHTGGLLIRVKPGRYYLKNVTPVHQGFTLPPNPEPSEPSQTVTIREGLVNYIGDWKFVQEPSAIRYDFELKFDLETVKAVAEKNNLSKYGLVVSKLGELPVKTAMPATE